MLHPINYCVSYASSNQLLCLICCIQSTTASHILHPINCCVSYASNQLLCPTCFIQSTTASHMFQPINYCVSYADLKFMLEHNNNGIELLLHTNFICVTASHSLSVYDVFLCLLVSLQVINDILPVKARSELDRLTVELQNAQNQLETAPVNTIEFVNALTFLDQIQERVMILHMLCLCSQTSADIQITMLTP